MVSSPSYDPNQFVQRINNKDYSALLNDKSRPLINRATQGQYAPASTIKPHLALLGLDEKSLPKEHPCGDPGFGKFPVSNVSTVTGDAGDTAGLTFTVPLPNPAIPSSTNSPTKLGRPYCPLYGAIWLWSKYRNRYL